MEYTVERRKSQAFYFLDFIDANIFIVVVDTFL